MRKLVLHHSAGKTVKLLDNLLKVFIIVFNLDLRRTANLSLDARNAQASL